MKSQKLNSKGFSHLVILLLIVVGVGIAGVYYQVASHADSRKTDRQKYAHAILKRANDGHIKLVNLKKGDIKDKTTPRENLQSAMRGIQSRTTQNCNGRGGTASNIRDTNIDMNILRFMLSLSKQTDYSVNSIVGQCHSGGSNHYSGNAVDLGCPLNVSVADKVAKKYGISRNGESCANAGHYHYSTNGR